MGLKFVDIKKIDDEAIYENINREENTNINVISVRHNGQEDSCIAKHWHRSLEIIIPVDGSTEAWVDGKIFHVYPGDFLIINSSAIHSLKTVIPRQQYFGFALQIEYEFIKSCYPDIDKYYFIDYQDDELKKKMISLFDNLIFDYYHSNGYSKLKIQSHLYLLMSVLFEHFLAKRIDGYDIKSDKQKDRLVEILSYLKSNCLDDYNPQNIANHFHLSYGHLANMFKENLGITMHEYVNSVRIKNSAEHLLTTDFPIIDIAMKNGFPNNKSFYREFKKIYKMTPKEFRIKNKKGE